THGNTSLEIVWTAVPAALVTAISIVSAVVLTQNEHLPSASASVSRAAQSSGTGLCKPRDADPLQPIDTTVQLQLQSRDVIHSFWVPEFGQKQDAVPGLLTKLVITPNRLGTFP